MPRQPGRRDANDDSDDHDDEGDVADVDDSSATDSCANVSVREQRASSARV